MHKHFSNNNDESNIVNLKYLHFTHELGKYSVCRIPVCIASETNLPNAIVNRQYFTQFALRSN